MSKIKQLSEQMTNRIAAGEVVERPAGIVKELVENAIDAKSSTISVEYILGGLEKIIVSDNGQGMDETDLRKAFLRHSTSKIEKEADLHAINSLGFRGEALPSIASVSNVVAKSSYDQKSFELHINNGNELSFEPISFGKGTTLEVSQLFYRLPARLKYLKTPQYEASRINSLMNSFALGYPEIAFSVKNENRTILETKGNGKLDEIIFELYGAQAASMTKEFSGESSNFKISGVYVLPHIQRANKYHEYFYLNSRMINYFSMNQVVHEVFHRYMPRDRFPILVLNINSDVQLVDVNVHPSKWQVKISFEKELLELVSKTLNNSLMSEMAPKVMSHQPTQQIIQPTIKPPPTPQPTTKIEPLNLFEQPESEYESSQDKRKVIAQHHGKYILAENEEGLFLFDQHASMERVMYEMFIKKMSEKKFDQQQLLTPLVLKKVPYVENLQDKLLDFGIEVDLLSESELIVRSLPTYLDKVDPYNFINSIFDVLKEDSKASFVSLNDHKIATMACKASIRFNERHTILSLQRIVDDLLVCENPYHCPHGRPTFVRLDPKSLLKEFSR